MNGIIVVDKPEGFTSFDVVAKMRGICATRKIGHGGTLDPMATGVLPVFIGRAARSVDLAPNQNKTYEAEVLFGLCTDTGDITGTVLQRLNACVQQAALQAVLPQFLGPQMQTPPMYSAVKVDGKPLYKYAREGQQVERKARPVTIYSLELLRNTGENRFELRIACSKGTYVRTLLEDIGRALEVPATMSALRRTVSGVFTLEQAHTLQEIQQAKDSGQLEAMVLDTGVLFENFPQLEVDDSALHRLKNGADVYRVAGDTGEYRLLSNGMFVGLGHLDATGTLKARKLFVEP